MIRINIPGFYDSDSGKPRWGDAQIIDDGKYYLVIDGYCGVGTDRLIIRLKERKIKTPYLLITHAHYDHYYGIRAIIRDGYFKPKKLYCYDPSTLTAHNDDIRDNINALKNIISEAKAKGITVVYLKNGQKPSLGELKCTVYRDQPSYKGNSDAYLNDGSLCLWFPELKYLTTGDAGMWCAQRYGLYPKLVKGGHHGNDMSGDDLKPSQMCPWLKNHGCLYYWDNDYSTSLTDFLMTGREDALSAGLKFIDIHGDINIIAFSGKAIIYKDSNVYRYSCSYKGKPTITEPVTLAVVKDALRGKYGNNDDRTTKLLNANLNPGLVQTEINTLYKLIKG